MIKRWWMSVLLLVVLALVASCARGSLERAATASQESKPGAPTVVVLDASDSMKTPDAPGPRWDAAKAATESLVAALGQNTPVGLVVFGAQKTVKGTPLAVGCDDVQVVLPLGPADAAGVSAALNSLAPRGFTPIGKALEQGAQLLPDGEASLVLVSDGASTCEPDPCETAAAIRADKPKITISAVGFRTDAQSLQCVAREGGGVFLTADNAAQLTARLAAAQDVTAANARLAPTGLGDATIGESLDAVAAAIDGFPKSGRTEGDRIIIVWKDCTYTFDADRKLIEIAPGVPAGATGVTIDGVKAGTAGSRAVELYGEPVSDSDGVATFVADKDAGAGYRLGYRGGGTVQDGTVTTVVLCRCIGDFGDKPEPVLGRDKFERYAMDFGTVRPASISIASTAASSVSDITWQSWGGADAYGIGSSQQNGAGNPLSEIHLRATDLGWCDGVWAYRGLSRTGSESAARSATRFQDICQGDRSTPASGTAPASEAPSKPGEVCGTHTYSSTGTTGNIVVATGDVSCAEAKAVFDRYFNDPSLTHTGNTASAMFDGWACASPTAVASQAMGFFTQCRSEARQVDLRIVPQR